MLPGHSAGRVREKRVGPQSKLSQLVPMNNPFRCFNSSPEVIRLAVML